MTDAFTAFACVPPDSSCCLCLSDASHHCDAAAAVIGQASGLSLAAAAAPRSGGDLHQDPRNDRSPRLSSSLTHTHMRTHSYFSSNDCEPLLCSKESFHLSSSGPGGPDQLHAVHLCSQLFVPHQPKLQVHLPLLQACGFYQPLGLQEHH